MSEIIISDQKLKIYTRLEEVSKILDRNLIYQFLAVAVFTGYIFKKLTILPGEEMEESFKILGIIIQIDILEILCPLIFLFLLSKFAIGVKLFLDLSYVLDNEQLKNQEENEEGKVGENLEQSENKNDKTVYDHYLRPYTILLPLYLCGESNKSLKSNINWVFIVILLFLPSMMIVLTIYAIIKFAPLFLQIIFTAILLLAVKKLVSNFIKILLFGQ